MRTRIISTQEEIDKEILSLETEGYVLISVSNTGLKFPFQRLTFVPIDDIDDELPYARK